MATNPWSNEIARINNLIKVTRANIARDEALLAADPNGPDASRLRFQIESGKNYLIDLQAELATFTAEYNNYSAQSTASSGQIVEEEATARAQNATASTPSQATVSVSGITDAELAAQGIETGTDGRIRTITETQATPPADRTNDATTGYTTTQAGVGAPNDDGVRPNSNATAQMINANFNQRIIPEPNVLDAYASYTYAISWYLLTPDQYTQMTKSQKKNCASWQLLIQSGGAPTQVAGKAAGRNKFFSLDYYIDDLEIDSVVPLKGTGAANTATDIKFRVSEPNGITLLENLYKAVSTLYQSNKVGKNPNYAMAQYCLAIRFYGYNDAGELVTTGRRGSGGKTTLTDPRAIVEKFYPFILTNIRFKVGNKLVEYDISAKPIPYFQNKSQDRGTIPFAFELSGETVQQILNGKPNGTVTPSSPGERTTTPQPVPTAPNNPSQTISDSELLDTQREYGI